MAFSLTCICLWPKRWPPEPPSWSLLSFSVSRIFWEFRAPPWWGRRLSARSTPLQDVVWIGAHLVRKTILMKNKEDIIAQRAQHYISNLIKNGLKKSTRLNLTISRRDKVQSVRLRSNLSSDSAELQIQGRMPPFDLLGLSMETMIPNHPLLFSSESICHQDKQNTRKKWLAS